MTTLEAYPRLRGQRGGVFYLHGEDHFRKEEVIRALVEAHVDPATRDFNLDQLRGTETDPQTLASVLATPPMMAEWRVVVLREVEGLASSKHGREELTRVATDPPPGPAIPVMATARSTGECASAPCAMAAAVSRLTAPTRSSVLDGTPSMACLAALL